MGSSYQGNSPEKKESTKKVLFVAAHDLNNVMMTIAGSAELLLEATGEDQGLRLMAERILRASKRGMALIDDLKISGDTIPTSGKSADEPPRQQISKGMLPS